jgi:hypothetical protein
MRRLMLSLMTLSVVGGFITTPSASAQQSINFYLGGFVLTSADARERDVLVNNDNFLVTAGDSRFRIDRFTGATFGGEYLVGLGDFFDAGLGVGFYQRSVRAFDANYLNTNGNNVAADVKLRIVPVDAAFRVLPIGHRAPIVPYVGVGVGIDAWRYSESGQFVDYTPPVSRNPAIFSDTFASSGTAVGPVVLGGIRVPIGPMAPGFEVRWRGGKADLPSDQTFSSNRLDLSGINYLFTFNIRF